MKVEVCAQKYKLAAAVLSLAAVMSLTSECYANVAPKFNGAGSSAAFNLFALAARISNGGTPPSGVCGNHNWTKKSTATGDDSRSSSISKVTGDVWIVWNDTPEPNRTVCAYLKIDSIVGSRLFYAVPKGTLDLTGVTAGEAGDNAVPLLPTDEAIPANIIADLNGQPFNAAPTDIRPEDAKFGTTRALTPLTSGGLGYGPGPVGASILSAFSTKSAQVVDFNISGTDPITGKTVPASTTLNVGAQVLLVLANKTDTLTGHLGNSAFNNVDRFVLSKVFDGTLTRTRDLIPSSGLSDFPLHVLNREPLSGTFNTFEFCIPRTIEVNSTQELGVNPGASGGNPLNLTGPHDSDATRQRVVGTSEMVGELGTITDSIGYAFFSFGNVSSLVATGKYLAVDGVDPLFDHYTVSNGVLPTCTPPCPGVLTFPNVVNGSYPIWNVLRVATASPAPAGVTALVSAAQSQVATVPEIVPIAHLHVFRSHYLQAGVLPSNGHLKAEAGGDMGGAVFTVQADLDNITDTGKELTGFRQ